ncbi:hypothetical protein DH2020_008134 [Rehmannia glutinosa]|uniref:Uncharacterized protein n=1 Tax=Rehmannia glutinosa TaxID=99300 RepID=A0ABR0U062_REHGL
MLTTQPALASRLARKLAVSPFSLPFPKIRLIRIPFIGHSSRFLPRLRSVLVLSLDRAALRNPKTWLKTQLLRFAVTSSAGLAFTNGFIFTHVPRNALFVRLSLKRRSQRPETAPPPNPNANANAFAQQGYGFMGASGPFGGFAPMATARFGNFTLSTALGVCFHHFLTFKCMDFRMPTCTDQVLVFHMGIRIHSMVDMLRDTLIVKPATASRFYLEAPLVGDWCECAVDSNLELR